LIDFPFLLDTSQRLIAGLPTTLALTATAAIAGAILAAILAAMLLSSKPLPRVVARFYVFLFRGSPLLVQIFLIYYGLSQFSAVRKSLFWPYLRDPYWCASVALSLNTAAYASEIFRGGVLSINKGLIEAARASGLSRWLTFRLVVFPLALRQALPAYGSEIILLVKASSLASTITLMEVTGIAAKIIAASYRPVEVFICAAVIYLALNFLITRLIHSAERSLSP
jgi:octopine/nopaline transport system permease protein